MPYDKRIKKNADGTYYVRYEGKRKANKERNQKYKSGFRTIKAAENFLKDIDHSILHGTYVDPDKITVEEYLNKWLEDVEPDLSPTSYSGYEVNIRCHINPYIGDMTLQELRAVHLKDLYRKLRKEGKITRKKDDKGNIVETKSPLSAKSILYVHRVLSKAFSDACDDEILSKNPAKVAKPPKVTKHKASFLDAKQIKTMLEKLKDDEMYLPVYLSAVLGLRRGEVLGLRWNNIDFEKKLVKIREEYTTFQGKPIFINDVKTEGSSRDIIVTDRIIKVLKNQKKLQKKNKLLYGKDYVSKFMCRCLDEAEIVEKNLQTADFVCTWPDGPLFNPSHISRAFKTKMKKLGLPEIKFHELRHSNGALMISRRVPMKGASDRLGHSTIVVTNDFYGHTELSVQEQIAKEIDEAIWGEGT